VTALPDELGSGQAQVLAALIRRCGSGPVTYGQLARDTGMSRIRVDRITRRLGALDLIANTPRGPMPLVAPLSLEDARRTAESGYAEARHESGRAPAQTGPDRAPTPSFERHQR